MSPLVAHTAYSSGPTTVTFGRDAQPRPDEPHQPAIQRVCGIVAALVDAGPNARKNTRGGQAGSVVRFGGSGSLDDTSASFSVDEIRNEIIYDFWSGIEGPKTSKNRLETHLSAQSVCAESTLFGTAQRSAFWCAYLAAGRVILRYG